MRTKLGCVMDWKDTFGFKIQFQLSCKAEADKWMLWSLGNSHAPVYKSCSKGSPVLGECVEKDVMDVYPGAEELDVMDGWRIGETCVSSHHLCLSGRHQLPAEGGGAMGSGSRLSKGGGPGTGAPPSICPRSA